MTDPAPKELPRPIEQTKTTQSHFELFASLFTMLGAEDVENPNNNIDRIIEQLSLQEALQFQRHLIALMKDASDALSTQQLRSHTRLDRFIDLAAKTSQRCQAAAQELQEANKRLTETIRESGASIRAVTAQVETLTKQMRDRMDTAGSIEEPLA